MATKTLTDLKRYAKQLPNDHFFDPKASESLGTVSIEGIYRAPYSELYEGYVITVAKDHAFVYSFEALNGRLLWFPIGRHESLADAEAFLASMGAVK